MDRPIPPHPIKLPLRACRVNPALDLRGSGKELVGKGSCRVRARLATVRARLSTVRARLGTVRATHTLYTVFPVRWNTQNRPKPTDWRSTVTFSTFLSF